ncbi:galactose mutarotase-like superfamily protein [Artemisia annua]|uniref:Galactose mutarotase-like superfamily protein n=1 Tax=Artemisia annua TaxID=35608 RepID=A0A2U1M525_ARTAN|nr:galactose mutarotase-like superfamily protein [Artemisia annua]
MIYIFSMILLIYSFLYIIGICAFYEENYFKSLRFEFEHFYCMIATTKQEIKPRFIEKLASWLSHKDIFGDREPHVIRVIDLSLALSPNSLSSFRSSRFTTRASNNGLLGQPLKKRERFTEQGDGSTFEAEFDRVYLGSPNIVVVHHHERKRTYVTWEVDECRRIGCVDGAVVANPITLKPVEELTGRLEITLKPVHRQTSDFVSAKDFIDNERVDTRYT